MKQIYLVDTTARKKRVANFLRETGDTGRVERTTRLIDALRKLQSNGAKAVIVDERNLTNQ